MFNFNSFLHSENLMVNLGRSSQNMELSEAPGLPEHSELESAGAEELQSSLAQFGGAENRSER